MPGPGSSARGQVIWAAVSSGGSSSGITVNLTPQMAQIPGQAPQLMFAGTIQASNNQGEPVNLQGPIQLTVLLS